MSWVLIRRVSGTSMLPTLHSGEVIFGVKKRAYRVGDIVIATQATTEVVKRITAINNGSFYLIGDNTTESVDSREYGPVKYDAIHGALIRSRKNR